MSKNYVEHEGPIDSTCLEPVPTGQGAFAGTPKPPANSRLKVKKEIKSLVWLLQKTSRRSVSLRNIV